MPRKQKKRRTRSFFKNVTLLLISLGFFGSGAIFLWAATMQVPDLSTFTDKQFVESTKIYDRTGKVLLYDVHGDIRRTVVPFSEISHHLKNATVAIEDASFYEHFGIQPTAIFRAVLVNIFSLGYEQGGSTITQQVVKNSLLTQEKTIARKLKEWVLSVKLETIASKERILELYLNEVPYGGNLYGVEEASKAFFGKGASALSIAESAYLAALPQAPTYYSPYGNNADELAMRKNLVLDRMYELGFMSREEYQAAREDKVLFMPQADRGIKAPHFVFYVLEQLERRYGREVVEQGGLRVITTLDFDLQAAAEGIVKEYVAQNIEKFNANNAGLVAIDPKTGNILVMVGSRDYFDTENDGNFNVAIAPNRQPGSAFKPFVYATAFMEGYLPETVVFDLPTQFHTGCDAEGEPLYESVAPEDCYTPENYDSIFRGPISLRNALAQSVNVPSVKTLYLAGLQDSLETAQKMGITSLTDPNKYGLTLVLGGGETSLLEMTGAYAVFAAEGERNPHAAIFKIEDGSGRILEEFAPKPYRAIPKETALQISDVLSDNDARTPAFGERSYLYFEGHDVAVKTGTTNDYRDAWIIGYTPEVAVGAWAGNNDNTPMEKKVAGFIIAPLWNAFMQEVFTRGAHSSFTEPKGLGNLRSVPPVLRGFWRGNETYFIDNLSGKLATEYTPEETRVEKVIANTHSILYWIDKNNPFAPKPDNPERDPQFVLWETSVRKWVQEQGIVEETREDIPKEYDTLHTPESLPVISLHGIDAERDYAVNERVVIVPQNSGMFPLSRIDVFLNNVYIGSTQEDPFMFSFIPGEVSGVRSSNTVRVVGYDAVMNKAEATAGLSVNI